VKGPKGAQQPKFKELERISIYMMMLPATFSG
jgi:hypothetical protein